MTLQAILYERGSLRLLDQRLLPFEQIYLDVPTPQAAWQQIKDMVVRGAPAIGVTGALALAVHLVNGGAGKQYSSVQECVQDIHKTMDYLVTRWVANGAPLACTSCSCLVVGTQPDSSSACLHAAGPPP
jgi:methylthioribose-1-phosphate isomerase